MNLTDSERSTVVNAIRVAAIRYHEDAEQMRAIGHLQLAAQFDSQVTEAEALADRIENEE